MNGNTNKLSEDWKGISTIIIYGFGLVAKRFIDKILTDFRVTYIIDNKKQGGAYRNIPIVGYAEVKEMLKRNKDKIIVMTSQQIYVDIRRVLETDGFVEGKDFCKIEQFAVEWYWNNCGKINIVQVNTAVSTWCTLNCEKCNMFMPYYKNSDRKHYTLNEMKEDIDILLLFVDYIFTYIFLGGEPFLNSELKNIISYIGNTYPDRIGKLGVTTNGTIIPNEETLEQLQKHHVMVSISDYTSNISYREKLEELIDVLNKWDIYYVINKMEKWKDFGFPETPFHWGKDDVCEHMKNCSPLFHGINDKKLYYCHVIWSADKAGIYTAPVQDYIDLKELDSGNREDRKKVGAYCMGKCDRGFLGFCMVCGGCGEDNLRIIPAGIQKM